MSIDTKLALATFKCADAIFQVFDYSRAVCNTVLFSDQIFENSFSYFSKIAFNMNDAVNLLNLRRKYAVCAIVCIAAFFSDFVDTAV